MLGGRHDKDQGSTPNDGAKDAAVKTLAFVFSLCISSVGAVGILVPSGLVWLAQRFVTSGAFGFYVISTVRIAFGLILISVASTSRAPKALRVLGYLILILGVMTALTGLAAVERGDAAIDWWEHRGSVVWRLTGGLLLTLGGFVAYACAPARRAT
jgi:uncharacterized membrane protein YidH (DUF202 family)